MLIDELRAAFLTGGLSDEQLEELLAVGAEVAFEPGDEPFHEGAPADFLWMLLEGRLELWRQSGPERIVLATMDTPGQWAGGLNAWGDASGGAGYRATGLAASRGRMFRVPSDELGRLVGAWFPFGKHMIVGIYQTIRGIEATVRQRESLIALGTLAAGLAHEINNPAAASLRAVEALRETCDTMLTALTDLAGKTITAEQYVALDGVRRELAERPNAEPDAVARMEREDAIGEWLEQRGVPESWFIAPLLASAGADQPWLEAVESAVGTEPLAPALRWTSTTFSASTLLGELTDTTKRIAHLVEAVKSYSQMDRASLQRIDIHEGIESTLVMLAMKLEGVAVERSFGAGVPLIDAYPGELNQVWTNLIDNAVDAMEGAGTLRVSTRVEGDHVVVDITDSGPGLPPEVEARVFEAFFTTKDVGKGTGLGLDISRRIVVDRHGGQIGFDSAPGATTVRVRLPLTR